MSGTLNANYVQADVGTNLYLNSGLNSGNVIVSTPIVANTVTSNTGAPLVLQSNNTTAITVDTSQNVTFAGSVNAPNSFGFKNRIINGGMVIDQRNAGASVTVGSSGGYYPVDRFYGQAAVASKFTLQQSTDVPSGQGFLNSIVATSSSAYSITTNDYFIIRQAIEGLNCYDFMFGSANAKTVILSFWVKSSLTGTFSGHLTNSSSARWYPFTYTVSSANTWTQISITIAGDQSGTWLTNNNTGIFVGWSIGTGSGTQATANTWTASTGIAATGSVNVVATNGATLYITGVQLEKGSTATSFDYRPYGTELQLCQRYFVALANQADSFLGSGFGAGGGNVYCNGPFPVTMRASPTLSYQGSFTGTAVTTAAIGGSITAIANQGSGINGWYAIITGSGTYPSQTYVMVRGSTSFALTASAEL